MPITVPQSAVARDYIDGRRDVLRQLRLGADLDDLLYQEPEMHWSEDYYHGRIDALMEELS